ncbi:ABC transporter ATP-binding protein [Paenibacillus sp. NEAU-GSW1]|uniref:ABC transporter ATP-binding protein n=1 Tax=Paenibacillus sp. NEAU-GSW1 TaxID=2682486 RepID=UPI0012E19B96|nr:ABC transporter ATP-binding protein [Paenibacillus sp. NEAU-GSW1]MUT66998.1 ATP-binding cassette domain-containing protein [Paenibacillus sp. NEAU-GSW1]
MAARLEVNQLTKIYEGRVARKALDHLHFTVEEGEFVGVMGPSGSGKTTLLNVIATIDEPTAGIIRLNGKDPHSLNKEEMALFRRRELGFVFQQFNLLDTLTVEENVALPLLLDSVNAKETNRRVQAVLQKLGIADCSQQFPYELSGGQMQRTAIARAIIHRPSLLLADEPTGNLDSKSAGDVMALLRDMNEQDRSTLLMVTHDAVAASYCSRVIFVRDGKFYNEIYRGDSRQRFFQSIIDMMSLLGGDARDLSGVRL